MALAERFLLTGKFCAFPEGGNRNCIVYIVGKFIPNLRSIKGKTMAKEFDRLID